MVHCSATILPSASRYTLRAMATAGIGSAVGRGRHLVRGTPRRVPAEDHAAGNSSWCVMRGRTRFVREEAIRRGVLETGRTSSNASSTSLSLPEPRAFASQPRAPGWAAVQPARIADLGVPTPLREGVNAATPTIAARGECCPGSTSGSGVYQQLYLQRHPARCLKPHRLTPFRVTNDVTRAPVHTAHERLMPCPVPPSWARRAQHRGASS
jgi:hypothetical protein